MVPDPCQVIAKLIERWGFRVRLTSWCFVSILRERVSATPSGVADEGSRQPWLYRVETKGWVIAEADRSEINHAV